MIICFSHSHSWAGGSYREEEGEWGREVGSARARTCDGTRSGRVAPHPRAKDAGLVPLIHKNRRRMCN